MNSIFKDSMVSFQEKHFPYLHKVSGMQSVVTLQESAFYNIKFSIPVNKNATSMPMAIEIIVIILPTIFSCL